jgi:hypothetical protein
MKPTTTREALSDRILREVLFRGANRRGRRAAAKLLAVPLAEIDAVLGAVRLGLVFSEDDEGVVAAAPNGFGYRAGTHSEALLGLLRGLEAAGALA